MTAVKSHCTSDPPSMSDCCEWRAGRECSSGNIFSHSALSGPRCERSFSHTVILMMSSVVPPAASTVAFICANMLVHCASSVSGILPSPSRPRMTPLITRLPIRQAFGIGLTCLKPPIWMLLRRAVPVMVPFLSCGRSVGRFRRLEDALHCHDIAEPRVAWPRDARDRIEGCGLDLAVVEQAVANVKHDNLADDKLAFRLAELETLAKA